MEMPKMDPSEDRKNPKMSRRSFLKKGIKAGAAMAVAGSALGSLGCEKKEDNSRESFQNSAYNSLVKKFEENDLKDSITFRSFQEDFGEEGF